MTIEDEVVARIRRHGPLPYDEVLDLALYEPGAGFYSSGGRAGRRGDFLTSPEVGPLFGAVLATALDTWWDELGRPDPFVVVEGGAGVGTLARTVLAAAPACLPALTYVLVERSEALRTRHAEWLTLSTPQFAFAPTVGRGDVPSDDAGTGPRVISLGELPAVGFVGVVLANELLDNLAFRLFERAEEGWMEVRVGLARSDGPLAEHLVPADESPAGLCGALAPDADVGARIPLQIQATDWLRQALALVESGRVVVFDYASTTPELAARPAGEWLRTYRGHAKGGPPLTALGEQDVTCEVAVDQLARVRGPSADRTQAQFLESYGIDQLVGEGRAIWTERAHLGDLEAIRGRSRVRESEALLDPAGLGAFRVVEWELP